jgi:thioredoxin 1
MSDFLDLKKLITFVALLAIMPGCSLFSPSKDSAPQQKNMSATDSKKLESNIVSVKTEAELDAFLAENKNVILDFWAKYCPPCLVMKRDNKVLANTFPNVLFVEVDIQKAAALAQKYKVHGIPNVYHIKDGKKVKHYVGKKGIAEREALIKTSFGLRGQ